MNEERKQKLIEALELERLSFIKRGQSTEEHDVAIEYLKTGLNPHDEYQYELLDAVVNDFDMTCSDYGC